MRRRTVLPSRTHTIRGGPNSAGAVGEGPRIARRASRSFSILILASKLAMRSADFGTNPRASPNQRLHDQKQKDGPKPVPCRSRSGHRRPLLFAHERILVVARRHERLLDRPRADPAHQVQLRTGLVVRARRARAAERLLADDRAGRLVVDVEVAGGVAQRARSPAAPPRDRARTPRRSARTATSGRRSSSVSAHFASRIDVAP